MIPHQKYEMFVKAMLEKILSKLNGSDESFERFIFPDKPSKIIVIGSLADSSKDFSQKGDNTRTLTTVRNNSLTVKFLISKNEASNIEILPSCSVFFRVFPSFKETIENVENMEYFDEIELPKVWQRKNLSFPQVNIDLGTQSSEFNLDFKPFVNDINQNFAVCSLSKINRKIIENEDSFNDFLKTQSKKRNFSWSADIRFKKRSFNSLLDLVEITFINTTQKGNYETFLFDCQLKIKLKNVEIHPFQYDYEYDEEPYSFENMTRSINCHAHYEEGFITLKHYSIFKQEKIIPVNNIDGLYPRFDILKDEDNAILFLNSLYERMFKFYQTLDDTDSKYRKNFSKVVERFNEGIKVLKTNPKALKAFNLMNETFSEAIKSYHGWRIFQIVFIVSQLPDIVDSEKRKDICEVLHIPTGGGKSETYFGLVIFSSFWDRLIGKKFGVTALCKFPLRMLSVQQLQRISNLMIWAEEIRKKNKLEGEEFSVGYFVGTSDDFPRYSKNIIKKIINAQTKNENIPGKFINVCPFCSEGEVVLDFNTQKKYVFHKCLTCDRKFKLFFSAEEIYRFIPTFIVSTVDKLAGIALNRRTKNLFGGKLDECEAGHGFIPRGDTCEVYINDNEQCSNSGFEIDISFSTSPTLVIQDEMHLIRESFGTIASHFESLLETLSYKLGKKRFKNIAMTATITGAKNQIKHLYHKQTNLFPPIPKDGRGNKDFFFKLKKENNSVETHRYFVGLKPNLRDNQYASLLTLRYISEYIKEVEDNLDKFSSKFLITKDQLILLTKNYKNILTYHGKKSDVHSMNYYLDTVTNSKLSNYKYEPIRLTGDCSLEDIKEIIKKTNTYHDKDENNKSLLVTFATSVVSHGVDIDRWNIMIFQGMPRNTAEYIQALSRIGRRFLGLAFIWFYPQRNRDLSYYKNFYDYHKILEHKVEEVPISRWPKLGFYQTFTSIFNASILNYISDVLEKPLYSVDDIKIVVNDTELKKKLSEFIKQAYIVYSRMKGAKFYRESIDHEIEERLTYLSNYKGGEIHFFPNALKDCNNPYFRTQFGMRGIQDEVILKPSAYDLSFIIKEEYK